MIAFKVVTKDRLSVISQFGDGSPWYIKRYAKGTVIKARSRTLGIFCFSRKKQALNFIEIQKLYHLQVIKIKALSRGKKPKMVSWHLNRDSISYFYNTEDQDDAIPSRGIIPPEGTICYNAIKVLT